MTFLTQSGINFVTYTQSTPSSTWVITHDFGVEPIIDINAYDSNGNLKKAFPLSVTHPDSNTAVVSWTEPMTGIASMATRNLV